MNKQIQFLIVDEISGSSGGKHRSIRKCIKAFNAFEALSIMRGLPDFRPDRDRLFVEFKDH